MVIFYKVEKEGPKLADYLNIILFLHAIHFMW